MKTLIATDLHLTERQIDKYRFGIFPFLAKGIDKYGASAIYILGDITDFKDNHSSQLVNAIVEGFKMLTDRVAVTVVMGNHDYLADPDSPFFKFLNHMKNIRFVTKPTMIGQNFFVPHIRSEDEWLALKPDKRPRFAFIHQTVTGAISESGRRLDGSSLKPLRRLKCPVFSGDVHKPHVIDPVTYIGPPYHIRFGDNFVPRCIVLDERSGEYEDVRMKAPRKWVLKVRDPDEIKNHKTKPGDMVKVELELTREEVVDWLDYKRRIVSLVEQLELQCYGIKLKRAADKVRNVDHDVIEKTSQTVQEVLGSFSKREKLPKPIRKAGMELLEN